MRLINLTPHPVYLYPPDTPDVLEHPETVEPILTVPPSETVARLHVRERGTQTPGGLPIQYVSYHQVIGLSDLKPAPGTWYVVTPPVALVAARDRTDLLVPYREVRNPRGTVVGCRAFGAVVAGP